MLTEYGNLAVDNTKFVSLEDTYVMNPLGNVMDSAEPMEVIIKCPHKRKRISALMSGGIKINGSAEWKPLGEVGIGSLGIQSVNDILNLTNWMNGVSVQQPWQNRKQWQTTKPFTLDIPLSFVSSMGDAKAEVFDPCIALLSFIYPRQLSSNEYAWINNQKFEGEITGGGVVTGAQVLDAISKGAQNVLANYSFSGSLASGVETTNQESQKILADKSSLLGAANSAFNLYSTPGPSLKYTSDNASDPRSGDVVTVSIGPVFNLGAVYLEDVGIEWSQTLNPYGYPLGAKVNLKCSPINACYCTPDGELQIFQNTNDVTDNISNCVNALQNVFKAGAQVAANAVAGVANLLGGLKAGIFDNTGGKKS